MIWRWSLLKQSGQFDDEFGNDAAARWLSQQQKAKTPVAPIAPPAPAPAMPAAPTGTTNVPPTFDAPPQATPEGIMPEVPGAEDDLNEPQSAREMRKQHDKEITKRYTPFLSLIEHKAVEIFRQDFANSGIQGVESGVHRALFDSATSQRADWKKFLARQPMQGQSGGYAFLPPELQKGPGKPTLDAINADLENPPETGFPVSLQAFSEAVARKDPQVFQLFMEAYRVDSSQKGGSGINESEDNRKSLFDLVPGKNGPKSNDIGSHMSQDAISALDDVSLTMLASPANKDYFESFKPLLQRYLESDFNKAQGRTDPRILDKKLEEAVKAAFKGDDFEGVDDKDLWLKFFVENPDTIPEANGNPAEFLDPEESGLGRTFGNPSRGWEVLKQLAQQGDQRVQEFFRKPIEHAIDAGIKASKLDYLDDFQTMTKDVSRISRLARAAALRELKLLKEQGGEETDEEGASEPKFVNAARRYFIVKNKMNLASEKLASVLRGEGVKIKNEKLGEKDYVVQSIGKGRLRIQKEDGTEATEITPDNFYEISRIVTPGEWVPKAMQDMREKEPQALVRPRAKAKKTPLYRFFEDQNTQWQQQQGEALKDPKADRLGGYRMALAQKFIEARNAAGATNDEIVKQLQVKARGRKGGPNISVNPQEWLSKLETGQPVHYNWADMNKLAQVLEAIAQQKGMQWPPAFMPVTEPKQYGDDKNGSAGTFFVDPPEFDDYFVGDYLNIDANAPYAMKSFINSLVHKKRENEWRGVPNMPPKSYQLFFEVLRGHANFYGGTEDNPKRKSEKPFGKMQLELTGGEPAGWPYKDKDTGEKSRVPKSILDQRMQGIESNPYNQWQSPIHHKDMGSSEYKEEGNELAHYPKEPDLTEMAKELGVPHGDEQGGAKKKLNNLYHVLEDHSRSPEEKQRAGKELARLRSEIAKLPPEQRSKFKAYLHPSRNVYDEMGNKRRESKPRMSMFDPAIESIQKIVKLAGMKNRMAKFGSIGHIEQMIDQLAAFALTQLEEAYA